MEFFKVTAKCGHVGKNNYYKANLYVKAENGKEAAKIAREMPRVKHDQKDAILNVEKISYEVYCQGIEDSHRIHYWKCGSVQEQRSYLFEIENDIYEDENRIENKKYNKRHSLRKCFNQDPLYEQYHKSARSFDYMAA